MKVITQNWEHNHNGNNYRLMGTYSEDYKYRYKLRCYRTLSSITAPTIIWVGVNPSVNTPVKFSKTFVKLITLSNSLGYQDFTLVNLFPIVESDPKRAKFGKIRAEEIAINVKAVFETITSTSPIVLMYGSNLTTDIAILAKPCLELFKPGEQNLNALAITALGLPMHPLFSPTIKNLLPIKTLSNLGQITI